MAIHNYIKSLSQILLTLLRKIRHAVWHFPKLPKGDIANSKNAGGKLFNPEKWQKKRPSTSCKCDEKHGFDYLEYLQKTHQIFNFSEYFSFSCLGLMNYDEEKVEFITIGWARQKWANLSFFGVKLGQRNGRGQRMLSYFRNCHTKLGNK